MRASRAVRWTALVAVLLGLAGCGVAAGAARGPAPAPARPAAAADPVPAPPDTPPAADTRASNTARPVPARSAPAGCASLDRCYPKDRMDQLLGQAETLIGEFSAAIYRDLPAPAYVLVPTGGHVPACGHQLDDGAYDYCPQDRTVYVGQEKLWLFYDRLGDAAAIAGLAHEWGHHVQNLGHVLAPTYTKEVQADCIAGAWLAFMGNEGRLEPGDLTDVDLLIPVISEDDTPDRQHGTVTERTAAFTVGLRTGIVGCNAFTPLTPLTR